MERGAGGDGGALGGGVEEAEVVERDFEGAGDALRVGEEGVGGVVGGHCGNGGWWWSG